MAVIAATLNPAKSQSWKRGNAVCVRRCRGEHMVLRIREPNRPRIQDADAWPIGPACIIGCLFLFCRADRLAAASFAVLNAAGLSSISDTHASQQLADLPGS